VKSDKDVHQAAVLCAVLGAGHPGALEAAVEAVPGAARKYLGPGVESLRPSLEAAHPRAWDELQEALPGRRKP
jgi:hypothetical protein